MDAVEIVVRMDCFCLLESPWWIRPAQDSGDPAANLFATFPAFGGLVAHSPSYRPIRRKHLRALPAMQMCAAATPELNLRSVVRLWYPISKANSSVRYTTSTALLEGTAGRGVSHRR